MAVVSHFNAVRLRVTGSGNLHGQLMSFDEVNTDILANLPLQTTNNEEPIMLANFTDQHASLYLYTNQMDDTFEIAKITVYLKPTATGYPQ